MEQKNKADSNQWWHDLVLDISSPKNEQNQLENWLTFTHAFRTLYQSFINQEDEDKLKIINYQGTDGEKKCINLSEDSFNPLIEDIIKSISSDQITTNNIRKNLRDDRMFVSAAYALSGPSPESPFAREQNYRIFTIAANVDRQQDASPADYVYSQKYIKDQFDSKIYKRWESIGSYYSFTDHSHIYLGYGKYMYETVSKLHVPYIYGHMTLLNLLYRGQLQLFEQQLCNCYSSNKIGKLFSKVETFTNQYWFHEVTEQQQGKEIFKLQAREMELEKYYQILNTEIKASEQNSLEKFHKNIGLIGLLLAFLSALGFALPGTDIFQQGVEPLVNLMETGINQYINPNYLDQKTAYLQVKTSNQKINPLTIWLMLTAFLPVSLILLNRIHRLLSHKKKANITCLSIVFFLLFQLTTGFILIKQGHLGYLISTSIIISTIYVYWAIKTILFNK